MSSSPSMAVSPALNVDQKPTRYRWVVLGMVFVAYVVCMADRSNIGAVLPFIQDEFTISNFQVGAILSFFFLGYAISQIPAGLLMGKVGTRRIVTIAIFAFSAVTFAMGFTTTAIGLLLLRLLLGLSEGPTPVGMTSTVNAWFPPREKGTATGIYIASTQFAPIIVPPIAAALAIAAGWRSVFIWFAIPGFFVAIAWWFIVRSRPSESNRVNAAERALIEDEGGQTVRDERSMGWLDKVIRYREIPVLDSNSKVLRSWNVWGNTLAYFFMNNVLYGMLTWIPSYLVAERGYDFMKMGFVASAPAIGGLIGALAGGVVSDRVFRGRRKPTMFITAGCTAIMMVIVLTVPQNTALVVASLVLTGFFLNLGWPMFTAYPMGLGTTKTYPFIISIVNSGGNLGGFFAPMIVGMLLDNSGGNYTIAFSYFVVVLVIAFVLLFSLIEPKRHRQVTAAPQPAKG